MTSALKIGFVVSVPILAMAAFFWWLAGGGSEGYRGASANIRSIQQLAAAWSVETAVARSNPNADYDALAGFIPEAARLKDALLETVQATASMPDRLVNDVYAFVNALDAKEERIERFKTSHSVIRNSVRFLPNLAASIARSTSDALLASDVMSLADGLGEYAALPTEATKGRLMAIVDRLAERQEAMSDDLASEVGFFLSHADILLDRQEPTRLLFEQATSGEVSDLADSLVAQIDAQAATLEGQANVFMAGIWASAVALLLVWVIVAVLQSRRTPSAEGAVASRHMALPVPAEPLPLAAPEEPQSAADEWASPPTPNVSRKLVMTHRITAEVVGLEIAERVRRLPASQRHGCDDAEQIAELATRLASASPAPSDRYDLVALEDCVRAALVATEAERGATVVTEFGDAPQIFASEVELCLVLEQIVDNALWAIGERDPDADEGVIRIKTAADDATALVTIIDNGIGLAAEHREHIFEPFAGTREDRPGIGLAIARHIVHKYNGRIAISSQPFAGTVVRISLPGMPA